MSTHQATPREREIHGQRVVFASAERAAIVPPGTVDLVVTSPPYWNLKDYGHPEQIGASSYEEYLGRLNAVWAACFANSRLVVARCVASGSLRNTSR